MLRLTALSAYVSGNQVRTISPNSSRSSDGSADSWASHATDRSRSGPPTSMPHAAAVCSVSRMCR